MKTDFILVLATVENFINAHQISKILVTEKLAACCTIIPNSTSVYEWDDKIEERKENLVLIKTVKDKIEQLKSRIKELHSDKVPEIISFKIEDGLEEYLNWVREVTK